MSAVPKSLSVLTPALLAELDRIAYEVRTQHELREDRCDEIPLRRRGRRIKKQPKTSVLVAAIERKRAVENRGTGKLLSLLKVPK